jgi:alpha-tubulin suppressor-like RCC1 family protein
MMRRARGLAFGLGAVCACSGKATKAGGLEVVVQTSGLVAGVDYDTVEVVVKQETTPGAWHTILDVPRRIPSETTLPATVSIQAGTSADQEVLIEVTALRTGTPVVQRGAQLQVPTGRVAELRIVLAKMCLGKVITCANGSCDPETGRCDASIVVDPSTLGDYSPGDVVGLDASAGTDSAGSPSRQDASTGAGNDAAPTNGDFASGPSDATSGDATSGDATSGDAAIDAGSDGPASTMPCSTAEPGVATLGCPCTTPAALACAGHAQKVTLTCSGTPRQWTQSATCGSGQLCETTPGVSTGTCVAIDPTCATLAPGALACSDATHSVTCGPDLVSDTPAATCASGAPYCLQGSCVSCQPNTSECVGNGVATCGSNGQWSAAVPCGGRCGGGKCLTVRSLTAGDNYTCVLLSDSSVWCWGFNADGELGNGTRTDASTPVTVAGVSATAVSAGENHTCAVLSSGAVACWGYNPDGQLGNGTKNDSPSAVTVLNLPGAIAVASGTNHTCAVATGGSLACWGDNTFGQLGNGTLTGATSAFAIPNTSGAATIAAMENTTCALGSNGTVVCWGIDDADELGNGASTAPNTCGYSGYMPKCSTSPTAVVSTGNLQNLIQVTAITAASSSGSSACALISGGTVDCWGDNTNGNLGNGSSTSTSTPTPVTGLTGVTAIAEGLYAGCAVVAGGALKCWGDAVDSLFGAGVSSSTTPVAVPNVSGATAIAMGATHTCIAAADGTVSCWGNNSNGQLGNGTTTSSPSPVKVAW